MYIANSLIERNDIRYKPGDIVPRLDDIENLIALGFVIVAAGGVEEYTEPEQESASKLDNNESEQQITETEYESDDAEQEITELEYEAPKSENTTPAPVLDSSSQQVKKFGRKK